MAKYTITYKGSTMTPGPSEVEAENVVLEGGWWKFYTDEANLVTAIREEDVVNVQRT